MDTPSMPTPGNISGSDTKSKVIKIFVVIALVVAGIFAFVMYFTSAMVDAANAHLELLKADDIETAYEMTADGFKETLTLEDYVMLVDAFPVLQDYTDVSFNSREMVNKMGLISGTITSQSGGVHPITIDLVKEDGEWKLYNLLVGDMHDYLDEDGVFIDQPEIYDLLSSVDIDADGLPVDQKTEFETGEQITFSGVISELPDGAMMTNILINSFGEEVAEVVVPFGEGGTDILFYYYLSTDDTQTLTPDDYVYEVSFDHMSLSEPVVANYLISIR